MNAQRLHPSYEILTTDRSITFIGEGIEYLQQKGNLENALDQKFPNADMKKERELMLPNNLTLGDIAPNSLLVFYSRDLQFFKDNPLISAKDGTIQGDFRGISWSPTGNLKDDPLCKRFRKYNVSEFELDDKLSVYVPKHPVMTTIVAVENVYRC